MKSTSPPVRIKIHYDTSEDQSPRSSADLNTISSVVSAKKNKLSANFSNSSSTSFDGQRSVRFSSLSSSYAQFLKETSDKSKKIVSQEFNKNSSSIEIYLFYHKTRCFLVITRRSSFIIIIK
jgi:hypothetical protein